MSKRKSILVKVSSIPPSRALRSWLKKYIPKDIKILYTLKSKVD